MAILQADTVLPDQLASKPGWVREQFLMAAVLEDALRCLSQRAVLGGVVKGRLRSRREPIAAEAAEWIASDDVTWPYSFENICAALGLNAEAIRRQLARAVPTTRYRPAA